MMIGNGNVNHLRIFEVENEVVRAENNGEEISDSAAQTIASWWQSPLSTDMPLTQLSTAGVVDAEELLTAISAQRKYVTPGTFDSRALDMLSTWALNWE